MAKSTRMAAGLVMAIVMALPVAAVADTVDLPRTGQRQCYDNNGKVIACAGTGQDAEKQAGAALPIPRFTDNSDGTVKDNLTGLIWLKNANCFGSPGRDDGKHSIAVLASGSCGLSDNSKAGDWRLPNVNELRSLVDYSRANPSISAGYPFYNLATSCYRSSTYVSSNTPYDHTVCFDSGRTDTIYYWSGSLVWPVKNNQ